MFTTFTCTWFDMTFHFSSNNDFNFVIGIIIEGAVNEFTCEEF